MNSKKIDIPRKAWVHKSGAIVPIPDEDFVPEDHGVFAVKNPESMPMAQYNFMRTIGDSYEPCKFNSLLEKIGNSKISLNESGGKSILGENPMQLTPRKLKRVLKKWKTHISVEEGSKHIRIISNATGNLVAVVSKSKELGPKTSIKTLTDVRNHLASIGAYTPEENESRGNITRRQNRVVDTSSKNTGPSVEDLKSRRDRLKDIVLARLGQKRQKRVVKALANTEKQISQASSN